MKKQKEVRPEVMLAKVEKLYNKTLRRIDFLKRNAIKYAEAISHLAKVTATKQQPYIKGE